MKRLFTTIFLWFFLTLLGVAILLTVVVSHRAGHFRAVLLMSVHDLLVFTIAGAIFCYLVSRYLTKPLSKLSDAAAAIADGKLSTRVDPSLIQRRDEIADLAHNFDRMAERIETLVTGQRRLLGDVSHELRSPLSRLVVALGLAKQGPSEQIGESLARIGVEAGRLDTLIGQLLALTRIDSGVDRGQPARVDLALLVQEIAADADFEARSRNRKVVVTRADSCLISGFEDLLRSAIENVVRNAVRHTAEATAVEISLEMAGGQARLRVRDHGPGVPDSMLQEIFQPFRRAPNGDSDGAGLGLAIAERAITVHRGQIRAANALPSGLIVEIIIPRN